MNKPEAVLKKETPKFGGMLRQKQMTQYTSDDQRVEMKESKKINKYLDLARELKNLQ